MSFEVNGRIVQHDPSQTIKCLVCGSRKQRFDEMGIQHFKDHDLPTVCLECQRDNRRKAKSEREKAAMEEKTDDGRQFKTSFYLDAYHRHALDALAFKFSENQREIVQRALDSLIARLSSKEQSEVGFLISMRIGGIEEENISSGMRVGVKE